MVFSHQCKTTTRQRQDNDKTNVEPVHSYDAFHTGPATTGVKESQECTGSTFVLSSCRCLALV